MFIVVPFPPSPVLSCLLILILNSSALRTKGPSHERAGPCSGFAYLSILYFHHFHYHWETGGCVAFSSPPAGIQEGFIEVFSFSTLFSYSCFHSQYNYDTTQGLDDFVNVYNTLMIIVVDTLKGSKALLSTLQQF